MLRRCAPRNDIHRAFYVIASKAKQSHSHTISPTWRYGLFALPAGGDQPISGYGHDLEPIQAANLLLAGTVGQKQAVLDERHGRVAVPAVGVAL